MTGQENTDEYLMAVLREASDHDPNRMHTSMWPAIEEMAAREGITIPAPMVTKTFTLEITARFPLDHSEVEEGIMHDLHMSLAERMGDGDGEIFRIRSIGPGDDGGL